MVRLDAMALVADFNAVAKLGSTMGYFDAQVVVKRFIGSDTTPPAIITNLSCAPKRIAPGSFAGVHTQEHTCLRVLPAIPTNTNTAHQSWLGSHVQVSQRLNITFAEGDSTGRHHARLFRNTVLGNLRDCADQMHKNVESMLLTSR